MKNQKPAKGTAEPSKPRYEGFTEEEKDAMTDRVQEQKTAGRRSAGAADGESEVLAKIAEMQKADRAMGARIHEVIRAGAPQLSPRLWYGQPAYAKDGKVVCFFQPAEKFKTRYATLGFSDVAKLDEASMWPSSFALTELTPDNEARIVALVKKAAG